MKKAEDEGRLSGIRLTPLCPSVQHLLFADDSVFIGKANEAECCEILRCLALYGNASGQQINFQESAITFGVGVNEMEKALIKNISGIQQEGGVVLIWGYPNVSADRNKSCLHL